MQDLSPARLMILAALFGMVLSVTVATVFIAIGAPDELKSLAPAAAILPPVVTGMFKIYQRLELSERAAERSRRETRIVLDDVKLRTEEVLKETKGDK
jgi:hypothetical protein